MREMVRGLFTRGLDPSIRWGFKEIRYSREELSTLMKMFPTASLIILARDFRGFAQSRFFAFGNTNYDFQSPEGRAAAQERLSTMSGAWIRRYQELLTVADAHPTRASLVAYSDLVPASPRFDSLFEELRDTPPDPAAIEAVLGAKSGSSFKFNAEARENSETLLELIDGAAIDWDTWWTARSDPGRTVRRSRSPFCRHRSGSPTTPTFRFNCFAIFVRRRSTGCSSAWRWASNQSMSSKASNWNWSSTDLAGQPRVPSGHRPRLSSP